jgi:transcriptional regulator with XRE-family HTH domain
MNDSLDYARAIETLRLRRGLTRHELAYASGVSYSYLCEIERGTKRPSADVLAKLAEAFGMKPSELVRFIEEYSRPAGEAPAGYAGDVRPGENLGEFAKPGIEGFGVYPEKPVKPVEAVGRERWRKPVKPVLEESFFFAQREAHRPPGKPTGAEVPHGWEPEKPGMELSELLRVASALDPEDLRLLIETARRLARKRS